MADKTEKTKNVEGPDSAAKKELSVEELTELLKRTQANFENYRKQMQTYLEDMKKMSAKDLIMQLLPVIDNFELALKSATMKSADQAQGNQEFIHGMKLIHSQLLQLLQLNNVSAMETKDKSFDPYLHEALMKVASDMPENKIMEEFQKGFMMHGKVLRHAKVKISAGPTNGATGNTNQKDNQTKKNETKTGVQ